MRIYTRRGDQGDTGLLGGRRVRKTHPRIAAFGEVDELNAFLGWARSQNLPREIDQTLQKIQHDLFALGAELASEQPQSAKTDWLSAADVEALERDIDRWQEQLPPLRQFILPGGTPGAAALHCARCVCRRAERQLTQLIDEEPQVERLLLAYLNRLGDLLFVLARAANHIAGQPEHPWQPPTTRRTAGASRHADHAQGTSDSPPHEGTSSPDA